MSNDNKLPTYEAGDVDQPYAGDRDNDYWVAAIDRTGPTSHGGVIECYGETEEEATALRDRLLAALPAEKPAAAAEHLIDSVYSALTDHDKRYTSRENVAAVLRAMPAAAAERGAVGHGIAGLGRMTDDDDGFVTLQFVSEAAASAFMDKYSPTVDIDKMPALATPPAQAAEPAQVDEVDQLAFLSGPCQVAVRRFARQAGQPEAEYIRSAVIAYQRHDDAPAGHVPAAPMWAILNACGVDIETRRMVRAGIERYFDRKAALTQRPAAPAAQVTSETTLLGSPRRADYVKAARVFAKAFGLHPDAPAYLPRTEEDAARFEPHAWVIAAMMQAYSDGLCDAPPLPPGFAMVPKRMTRAMRDVVDTECWEWRDLLAAAEAITEAEYDSECEDTGPAAPLATDAGAKASEAEVTEAAAVMVYDTMDPFCAFGMGARWAEGRLAAHPAAERPAQGEAQSLSPRVALYVVKGAMANCGHSWAEQEAVLRAIDRIERDWPAPRAPEGGRTDAEQA